MSTPLRVSKLAALCGSSREHFERRFKREMGCTPVEYIRERRLQVAVHRLCHTRRSIEEIALETGFGSRAYFTRMFTREKGLPPGRFRAEHGAIETP